MMHEKSERREWLNDIALNRDALPHDSPDVYQKLDRVNEESVLNLCERLERLRVSNSLHGRVIPLFFAEFQNIAKYSAKAELQVEIRLRTQSFNRMQYLVIVSEKTIDDHHYVLESCGLTEASAIYDFLAFWSWVLSVILIYFINEVGSFFLADDSLQEINDGFELDVAFYLSIVHFLISVI